MKPIKASRVLARQLYDSADTLRLNDVVYFPERWSVPIKDEDWAQVLKLPWFRERLGRESLRWFGEHPGFVIDTLQSFYEVDIGRYCGREPAWIHDLPKSIKRYLRVLGDIAAQRAPQDIFQLIPRLPFIGFGLSVEEGGMVEAVYRHWPLPRLARVRQLGMLSLPVVGPERPHFYGIGFQHTRYVHSLIAYAFATLWATTCGLTEDESTVIRLAALTHDLLTPAGSDTTKQVDPVRFNEDVNYFRLFEHPGWPALADKFQVNQSLLLETIAGQGPLGKLLDLADKLSYTLVDADSLRRQLPRGVIDSPELDLFHRLLESYPFILSWWDRVMMMEGQMVVASPRRLANFLLLRALMFKILYLNPAARLVEEVYGLALRFLYERGEVTTRDLLDGGDEVVKTKVSALLGESDLLSGDDDMWRPRLQMFETEKEAVDYEQTIHPPWIAIRTVRRPIKSALDSFPVLYCGRVESLRLVRPAEATEIERLIAIDRPYCVYSWSIEEIHRHGSREFARWLEERRGNAALP